MATALTPAGYTKDTRPREIQKFQQMDEQLRLINKPSNTNVVPTKPIVFNDYSNATPQIALVDPDSTGFFYTTYYTKLAYLPPAESYKLDYIQDIILSVNVFAMSDDASGFANTPSTDFTMDFYLSLYFVPVTDGNLLSDFSSFVDKRALCIPFTFNFFTTTSTGFTITSPSQSFKLSDTIPFRTTIIPGPNPDFNDDPTKITETQYESLKTDATNVAIMWGYDSDQYTALSAGNQAYFDDLFNLGIGGTEQVFGLGVEGSFSYFGLTASYQPIT